MLFGQDRGELRNMFFEAWRKRRSGEGLEPLERAIVEVVELHPEYHALLTDPERNLDRDYLPEGGETNPFLHMSLHIAVQEQLGTDRPAGIRELYQAMMQRLPDAHAVEHEIMECLMQMLWEAQRENRMPDEEAYLACLRRTARRG